MSAWDHLPNAAHIDRVLASVKSHPKLWNQAEAPHGVWAWNLAWMQARDQARYQTGDQAWDQAGNQAGYQVRGAILALVAYDDCAKYLNLPIDQLEMIYQLSEHPACLLLQPAVLVFEKEKELA
jgi:hypothetical protein